MLIIEVAKMFGLPKDWCKPVAFILALIFAGLFFWNQEWLTIIKSVFLYAFGSIGLYEATVKVGKDALK